MKSIMFHVALAAWTAGVLLLALAVRGGTVSAPQSPDPVAVTRLYTGADGLSHVAQVHLVFPTEAESEHRKAASTYVVRVPAGHFEDWHHPGRRRYVLPMSGRAELGIAGGEKVAVEPGRLYLAEDLTGQGHTFRVVGEAEWVALFVDFEP